MKWLYVTGALYELHGQRLTNDNFNVTEIKFDFDDWGF